jgi:hypothetical protein
MNPQQRLYKSRSDAVYDITPGPKVTKEEDLQLLKFQLQIYELSGERELNFSYSILYQYVTSGL